MKKKVLISVGGTGGHIYPALALASELQAKHPEIELLFVGGKLKTNRYFQGQPYAWEEVSCGSILRKNPFSLIKSFLQIIKGVAQSRKIIKNYNPDLVLGFGSYHTFPTLIAAKMSKIPVILHEANSIPGKVNRMLSRHVDVTAVHFPETASYLHGTTVEVGMPLRPELKKKSSSMKKEAYDYYELSPNKKTVLVFGGSQGAKAINTLFSEALTSYLLREGIELQVIHFTGDPLQTVKLNTLYASAGIKACVKDMENKMNMAYAIADFVVSRAGAATIAEQLEFEVPAILIPYPYATDKHQDRNADFMVAKVGAALKFTESTLTAEKLSKAIKSLLANDYSLLNSMREAIKVYKTGSKQIDLCSLVCELLEN